MTPDWTIISDTRAGLVGEGMYLKALNGRDIDILCQALHHHPQTAARIRFQWNRNYSTNGQYDLAGAVLRSHWPAAIKPLKEVGIDMTVAHWRECNQRLDLVCIKALLSDPVLLEQAQPELLARCRDLSGKDPRIQSAREIAALYLHLGANPWGAAYGKGKASMTVVEQHMSEGHMALASELIDYTTAQALPYPNIQDTSLFWKAYGKGIEVMVPQLAGPNGQASHDGAKKVAVQGIELGLELTPEHIQEMWEGIGKRARTFFHKENHTSRDVYSRLLQMASHLARQVDPTAQARAFEVVEQCLAERTQWASDRARAEFSALALDALSVPTYLQSTRPRL